VKNLVILPAPLFGAAPFFTGQIPSQSLKVDVHLVMINATEYFLILFADKLRVEIDLTKDISKVQNIPFIDRLSINEHG